MPRLQTYTRQVSPTGQQNIQRATATDFGGGEGLAAAGQAIEGVAGFLKQKKDNEDALEIETQLIKAETHFAERQEALKGEVGSDAKGFTEKVGQEVTQYSQDFSDNFSSVSPENKRRLSIGLARLQASSTKSAMRYEGAARSKKMVGDTKEGLAILLNNIRSGNTSVEDAVARAENLVSAGGVSADIGEVLLDGFRSAASANEVDFLLSNARTPEAVAALEEEVKGKADTMTNADFNSALSSISSAKMKLQQKAALEARKTIDASIINNQYGDHSPVDDSDFARAFPDDMSARQDAKEAYERSLAEGERYNRIDSMSPAEQVANRDALEARIDEAASTDPEEALELRKELSRYDATVSRLNKEFANDQALFAHRRDESLQVARENYESAVEAAKENPESKDHLDALTATLDNYVSEMISAQVSRGAKVPRLLTNSEVDNIKTMVATAADDADNPDALREMFAQQSAKWGEYWPMVSRQLIEDDAITGVHSVLAYMSGDTSMNTASLELSRVAGVKDTVLQPDEAVRKSVKDLVKTTVTDFSQTLNWQGAYRTSDNFRESIYKLSLAHISKNVPENDAVNKAYNEVVGNHYDFHGSYRVPKVYKGKLVSGGGVTEGAAFAKDVEYLSSIGLYEDENVESIAAHGQWVTAPDESGLILTDEAGRIVDKKDGEPMQLSWSELQEVALDFKSQRIDVRKKSRTGR